MRVRYALGVTCLASTFAVGACDRGTPGTSRADGAHPDLAPLRPLVDIGGDGGPEELSGVTGAVSLSDGRIVIGNGATNEIRVFSDDGNYLETIGRRGGGPGEFYSLLWVGVAPGDTILAYDIRSQRLSWFAPDG
jgi:6-bladed beta-propeller